MSRKFTSTVAGASLLIATIGLLGRGIGFIREVVFASYFGIGKDFDIYLVGAVLPITVGTILLYTGQNYFIPSYNNYKQNDTQEFVGRSFITFLFFGLVIAFLLFIAANPIINLYMGDSPASAKEIAYYIYIIFLITIPLSAGTSILSAYFQSVLEFRYPTFSRLFLSLSTIVFVLLFGKQVGVFIIAIGYLTGSLLQFLYLLIKAKLKISSSVINFFKNKTELQSIFGFSMVSIILIEAISQLYVLFDRYFYNEVSTGGIAALNYAQTLFAFPVGILSYALATAIFPKLSASVKEKADESLKSLFTEAMLVILLLFTPITFIFTFFPREVISLIFERGNFNAESTFYTATALRYFSYSLIFYAVYAVINKVFYSTGLIKTLLIITMIGSLLKILLNFILVKSMLHNGLALGSTISYLFLFVSCFMVLNFKLKLKITSPFISNLFIMIANSFISFLIVQILFSILNVKSLVTDFLQIIIFMLIFIMNIFLINHPSVKIFLNVYRKFKGYTIASNN